MEVIDAPEQNTEGTFGFNNVKNELIGVEKESTITAYLIRDNYYNLEPVEHIKNCLIKLGYFNINQIEEDKKRTLTFITMRIFNSLNSDWNSNIRNSSINDLFNQYYQSEEYDKFINQINKRIARSVELSVFMNQGNLRQFYEACTMEELCYLDH